MTFLLFGCQHYARLTSDDFAQGHAPRIKFARDNYTCEVKATVQENITGGGDSVGIYNDAYVACMKKLGYQTSDIDLLGFSG